MVLREVGYKARSGFSWLKIKFRGGLFFLARKQNCRFHKFREFFFDQMRDYRFPKENKMCLDRWLVNLLGPGCTDFPKI